MLRLIIYLQVLWFALPAFAQDWATRELCTVTDPKIHQSAFEPDGYAAIQASGALIENGVGKYWRITSPDGAVSHLWGTIHSNDPQLLSLPEEVEQAIKNARIVAIERDFIFKTRAQATEFYSGNRFGNGTASGFTWLNLPTELQMWIRSRFIALGWGSDAVDYLPLSEIVEVLLADPCGDFADGTYPIQDSRIQMLGAMARAEILGLESPDMLREKLTLQDNRVLTEAIIGLYGAYLNPDVTNEDVSTYYALYQQGRLGEWIAWERAYMTNLFSDEIGLRWLNRADAFLLTERNANFVNAALPQLESGGVFIAVGAFHLPGETGLVRMLRDAGYKVTRVTVEGEAPG